MYAESAVQQWSTNTFLKNKEVISISLFFYLFNHQFIVIVNYQIDYRRRTLIKKMSGGKLVQENL